MKKVFKKSATEIVSQMLRNFTQTKISYEDQIYYEIFSEIMMLK